MLREAPGRSGKQTAVRTAPIVCPEESPLVCSQAQAPCPIDTPTPRRGCRGRAESHPASMTRDSFAVRNYPLVGIDAPTPARIGTGRPKGRSHFSFGGERKVCKRKPAARRLREKALYCPFLKEGVRNVARSMVKLPTWTFVRARAHSFPLCKKGKAFSLRCLSPLCSPAVGVGQAYPLRVGMLRCSLDIFAARMNGLIFLSGAVGGGQAYPLRGEMLRCSLGIFATQKASVSLKSRWPF